MAIIATVISLCLSFIVTIHAQPTIPSRPEPPAIAHTVCNENGSYQSNSSFGRNLEILLQALLKDIPSPAQLLKEHVEGANPYKVYGFTWCGFSSLSQDDCSRCTQRAVYESSSLCPKAIGGMTLYDECAAGYGAQNITTDLLGLYLRPSTYPAFSPFQQNLNEVRSTLTQKVPLSHDPVALACGDNPDRAFGFAECHNLSKSDCIRRIDSAISQVGLAKGAEVAYRDAFFRYENYSFFTGGVSFQLLPSMQSPPMVVPSPSNQQLHENSPGHVSNLIILISIIGGATFLAIFIILVICIRKKNLRLFGCSTVFSKHPPIDIKRFKGCRLFSYEALKDATRNFHEENKLGKGGFGVVYKGILSDGSEVAIKHLSQSSAQGNKEFLTEVSIITNIRHKNLVKLKGCCIQGEERLLVYEYLEHKSLDHFLFGQYLLNWKTRCNIAIGIARGLDYLHEESEPSILHRDIKVGNVLLDINFQPKISDFGLSRIFSDDQSFIRTMKYAGTRGYLAPEATTGYLTIKSDVYSFGVLLLEIVSGRMNQDVFDKCIVDWAFQLCEEGRPIELVDPRLDGDYLENQAINLINIAMLCVQRDAVHRPKMSKVVAMLLNYAKVGPWMSKHN
ncbi:hypothetical protein O6H91_03G045100 [Diphasiastrum complanatum]|uniref:Uncharacterized protein n=2 Tax=Diphasiastrum complanatum TaxID=34168 RepID=A0ACC2E5U0_DIPCM|nr:hypothetical protein O6H91_03G045100 [Diphasiastrum complanatum]KAJ7561874.1 hypothetical protein O6H91_03G045100 [Diphasiastrum complanatum]